ncbi:MAG: hypothetical protein Q4E65_07420 [Clostridia bacterium]|nr:hypothetical protein [Clostridia bacterium]
MRDRSIRSLFSFFLAALLLFGVLFTPAVTLAGPNTTAEDATTFLITTACEQFITGQDNNAYPHNDEQFGESYFITDDGMRDKLFAMVKNDGEYNELFNFLFEDKWEGSCYGIATTMAINRLSQYGDIPSDYAFTAADMQAGAENYYDIKSLANNELARNWVNFYMVSQALPTVTLANDAMLKVKPKAVNGKMQYDREALTAFVEKAKAFVDDGQPFLFSYFYRDPQTNKGYGHAIVGCDYYIVEPTAAIPGRIYIKLYDENLTTADYINQPFYFIALELDQSGVQPLRGYTDTLGNERIVLCRRDGAAFVAAHILTGMEITDVAQMQRNIVDAGNTQTLSALASAASAATLSLDDVAAYGDNFRIKPFAYDNNDVNNIRYADQCGKLYSIPGGANKAHEGDPLLPAPPEPIDSNPIPVNAANVNEPFAHMIDYRYESFHPGDPLGMEIDLKTSGSVKGEVTSFNGFDLVLSDGSLPGASLLSDDHYAWVSGDNLDYVRYSANAHLRDVIATSGGSNLKLYFGTGDGVGLDMFSLSMDSFSSMQVFDEEDGAIYSDCVVLRMDGAASGFNFNFYKGTRQSGEYAAEISATDPDHFIWVKIKARELPSGEIGVDIWTEETEDADTAAKFEGPPSYTSYIQPSRTSASRASSISGGSNAYSGNQYPLTGGAGGVMQPDGSVSFTFDAPCDKQTGASIDGTPLQKGADYDVGCGSTVVTLKPARLAALKDGAHTLTVYFTDGMAQTTFTTPLSGLTTSAMPDVPATGGVPGFALALPAALLGWLWRKKR